MMKRAVLQVAHNNRHAKNTLTCKARPRICAAHYNYFDNPAAQRFKRLFSTESLREKQEKIAQQALSGHKWKEAETSTGNASTSKQQKLPGWFYIFPVVTMGLGTWQIFRRQEKKEMIKYRTERLKAPSQPLPPQPTYCFPPYTLFPPSPAIWFAWHGVYLSLSLFLPRSLCQGL